MGKSFFLWLMFLVYFLLIGCSGKNDYVLFINNDKKPKMYQNYPFLEEKIYGVTKKGNSEVDSKTITLDNVKLEYKIVPGDRISVRVYKHPEFSTQDNRGEDRGVIVDENGYVNLLLVGKVKVGGLTTDEALGKITDAFKEYLKEPSIQIDILNKKVYVLGEVNRPGELEMDRNKISLLKLLAKAGDLTYNADRRRILVFKQDGDNLNILNINLLDYDSIKLANIMIEPNDVVYVTPDNMKTFNVKVKNIDPIFSLLSHILQPFVNIKYLTK